MGNITKQALPLVIIAAIVIALLHIIPFSKNMDIEMEGTVRNADGEVLASCAIEFDGKERRYLLGKKGDVVEGSLELTGDFETISSLSVHLGILRSPDKNPDGTVNPFKDLTSYTGTRYDPKTNAPVRCGIYTNAHRSAYILVDNGTIYCFTTLEESAFLEFFVLVKQHATNDLALNPKHQ